MESYKIIGIELKNRSIIIVALLCVWIEGLSAQQWEWWPLALHDTISYADTINYQASVSTLASSGKTAPFLLYANQHGNISHSPYSSNAGLGIYKHATCPSRWWDYDFSVQIMGRYADGKITGFFEQLYAHARLFCIDITVGIHPYVQGSQDNNFSMGSLLFSGNAHPIPRITIGIDDYIAFPGLYGYLEIKGGITHGWLYDQSIIEKTKLHHKFIGLRVGGEFPVTLAYEMHHAAQWGGYNNLVDYGNTFSDFWNVFLFRSGGITLSDQLNAQGNHIGVQELALSYKQKNWQVKAYWQSIFEDMSAAFIGFGMNASDGLWGVNIQQKQWPYINHLSYELLNTTSQSGPMHDKDGLVFAGRDSYYNNSAYPQGWTYYNNIIGNPYLQTNNNRVRAHFAGLGGDLWGYKYRFLTSYVKNYGSYQKPQYSENIALLLEVSHQLDKVWGLDVTIALAGDIGTQYGNQIGGYLRIAKKGIIVKY